MDVLDLKENEYFRLLGGADFFQWDGGGFARLVGTVIYVTVPADTWIVKVDAAVAEAAEAAGASRIAAANEPGVAELYSALRMQSLLVQGLVAAVTLIATGATMLLTGLGRDQVGWAELSLAVALLIVIGVVSRTPPAYKTQRLLRHFRQQKAEAKKLAG